jgi:hypothetical protein
VNLDALLVPQISLRKITPVCASIEREQDPQKENRNLLSGDSSIQAP